MKRSIWGWVVLGVALAGSAFAQSTLGPGPELARQYRTALPHYDKAVRAFSRKDYVSARRELDAAIDAMPQYSYAHLLMAKCWYMAKEYEQALPAIERAESAWHEFAGIVADSKADQVDARLRKRRDLQDQIAALQDDLRRAATPQIAQQIQTYIDQLQHQISDIDTERVSEALPAEAQGLPAEYSFVHGNTLLRLGRLIDAEPQYQRAIEANPHYGEAFNNLASLYYQAGRYEEARKVLQEARGRDLPISLELEKAVEAQLQ